MHPFVQLLDILRDMPILIRHYVRNLFSVGGIRLLFRFRSFVFITTCLLYIVLPLDLLPEALFGILGLIDDLFIILCAVTWLSIQYRNQLINEWYSVAFLLFHIFSYLCLVVNEFSISWFRFHICWKIQGQVEWIVLRQVLPRESSCFRWIYVKEKRLNICLAWRYFHIMQNKLEYWNKRFWLRCSYIGIY